MIWDVGMWKLSTDDKIPEVINKDINLYTKMIIKISSFGLKIKKRKN